MSDSQFEVLMDQCIGNNLKLCYGISIKTGINYVAIPENSDLDAGITYRISMHLENIGSEISFAKVYLSIHTLGWNEPLTARNVAMYEDDELTKKLPDHLDKPVSDLLAPGKASNPFSCSFRVIRDPDSGGSARLFRIGIYGDIVPRGHAWQDISWKL